MSTTDSLRYRPRDVINAPQLRDALVQRSRRRGDPAAVSQWLGNHFWRAMIGSFPNALPVTGAAGWRSCFPGSPMPDWFALVDSEQWYIDPQHPRLLEIEQRIVEFLRFKVQQGEARKLPRISCEQALRAWQQAHARLQQARLQGQCQSQPGNLREVLRTANGRIVEIHGQGDALRMELAYESSCMQHCLGQFADRARLRGGYGEQYAQRIAQRESRVFSLRDPANRPHVTISLERVKGSLCLGQVKGKQNRPPVPRYRADVLAALDHLKLSSHDNADCLRAGLIDLGEPGQPRNVHYSDAVDTPQARMLLVQAPWLAFEQPRPSRAGLWLALAGDESAIIEARDPPMALLAAVLLPAGHWRREDYEGPDSPAWLARLQALAGPAPRVVDWRYRSLGHPLLRWLNRLMRPSRLREAMRWALATTDLKSRALGIFRQANDVPGGALGQARACALLQTTEKEQGSSLQAMVRSQFRASRLKDRALCAWLRAERFDPLDIIAYEAIEGMHLLRLGLAAGRLAPSPGLPLLLLQAQRLRDCFDSWESMARAYSRGRHAIFSRQSPGIERNYRIDREIDAYLQDRQCNWQRLAWDRPALLECEQLARILMQHCRPSHFSHEEPHDSQSLR